MFRRLLSWSIIGYFSYYFFYGCGSPFDITHEKPGICEPIDTLKLDLYSFLESAYFKTNVSPYIDNLKDHYLQYGLPIQKKSQAILNNYGVPLQKKGKQVFHETITPKFNEILSNPLVQEKKAHVHKVYNDQLSPWLEQIQQRLQVVQDTVTKKYHDLPPPVAKRIDQLVGLYHQAENTELKPILIKYYWILVDFYNNQFEPLVYHNQYIEQLKTWVNQHEQIQTYRQQFYPQYQQYVESSAKLLKKKFHLEALYQHLLSLLPQRPTTPKQTVGSSIIETKTPEKVHKTIDIPITSSISKAFDSVKEKVDQITQPVSATEQPALTKVLDSVKEKLKHVTEVPSATTTKQPILSKAFDSIKDKLHPGSSSTTSASVTVTKAFDSLKDKIRNIHPTIPAFHVKNQENDHISDSTKSVKATEPFVAFNEKVDEEQVPKAQLVEEEEESLIEQIKQEEFQAENEEILDEIKQEQVNKEQVVEKDKQVVQVPDEKELFEVHKKEPQSPLVQEESKEAPLILDDVIILEDQVIIPPPPSASKAVPEEPVDPEEEVIML